MFPTVSGLGSGIIINLSHDNRNYIANSASFKQLHRNLCNTKAINRFNAAITKSQKVGQSRNVVTSVE
jgi:hypothetical protein